MELTPDLIASAVAWFAVFVFSTTLHEAAHAWAALRLGDETAYAGGQVSLNPAPHIAREPFGMVLVPLVSFFLQNGQWMIGWASAPYDPQWAQRYPKRSALMALAGPVANLLLVLASGVALKLGLMTGFFVVPQEFEGLSNLAAGSDAPLSEGLAMIFGIAFLLNLVLFLFNLLPLPPMDGSAVIQYFMPEDTARKFQVFLYQPMWALVGLLAAWRFFPVVFGPVYQFAVRLLWS